MNKDINNIHTLYTIGYTAYSMDDFIGMLIKHDISAVADVRSSPFSSYYPEFNQDALRQQLNKRGIFYVQLGEELGARQTSASVYINGQADYGRIAKLSTFQNGLDRLFTGLIKHNIALMCAEKDPMTCHRSILICRNLRNRCNIMHIWPHNYKGEVIDTESHECLEQRLLKKFGRDYIHILKTFEQLLDEAYDLQGKELAYKADEVELLKTETE